MTRSHHVVVLALLAATIAGCGEHSRSKSSSASGASPVTSSGGAPIATDTITSPPMTAMNGAHGELVVVPRSAGGSVLAFQPDAENVAYEITDFAALRGKGVRLGTTLSIDADVANNLGGKTSLAKAVTLVNVKVDDVATYGTLSTNQSGATIFRSVDGAVYLPTGPLAADFTAHPTGRPVFVAGELIKTSTVGPLSVGTLEVSAWRPTTELTITVSGGLIKQSQSLRVLDLERRGAYRFERSIAKLAFRGKGLLPRKDLVALQKAVMKADLRSLKPSYGSTGKPSGFPFLPIARKLTTIEGADLKGTFKIAIGANGKPPAALAALVRRFTRLASEAPRSRVFAKGSRSRVKAAAVKTATTGLGFARLWATHSSAERPTVSFDDAFVVAAFAGRSTTETVTVEQVERVGADLYVTTRTTRRLVPVLPLPFLSSPAPYAFARIDTRGLKGRVFVDGKRVGSILGSAILPTFPKLPFFPQPAFPKPGIKTPGTLTPKLFGGIFGAKLNLQAELK